MGEYLNIESIEKKYSNMWFQDEIQAPEISVIIPAYNAEKYIEECLASLLKQTFKNFEVVIINDGSVDKTAEIADVFQRCDKRFTLYSQENRGACATWNRGLELVKGKYITFIDNDDWIDDNYFELMLDAIVRNDADIACSTAVRLRKYNKKYRLHFTEENVYTNLADKIKACDVPVSCYVWGKFYKSELIKTEFFKEDKTYGDILWLPEIIKKSNKLVTVPNTNYYYVAHSGSTVKKPQSEKNQKDVYFAKKYIIKFFEENNLDLAEKEKRIPKAIKYLFGFPVIKIKEYKNEEYTLLFGIIPIYKSKVSK